jgi:hypothetical protein
MTSRPVSGDPLAAPGGLRATAAARCRTQIHIQRSGPRPARRFVYGSILLAEEILREPHVHLDGCEPLPDGHVLVGLSGRGIEAILALPALRHVRAQSAPEESAHA